MNGATQKVTAVSFVAAAVAGLAIALSGSAAASGAPTNTPYPTEEACNNTKRFYQAPQGYAYRCRYYPSGGFHHRSGNGPGWYIMQLQKPSPPKERGGCSAC